MTEPPSGNPPPTTALTPDGPVDLVALSEEICRRYHVEYPDEDERYGAETATAWCVHDNQHLLNWAIADAHAGLVDMDQQARWLANILESRDFPLDRFGRCLVIGADVVSEQLGDEKLAERLRTAAEPYSYS